MDAGLSKIVLWIVVRFVKRKKGDVVMRSLFTILIGILLALSTFLISGCGRLESVICYPEPIPNAPPGEAPFKIVCKGKFWNASLMDQTIQEIDTTKVFIDVSGGTSNVTSFAGPGKIKKKSSSGETLVSASFTWVKIGNSLVFVDPTAVSNILNSAPGQAVEFEFSFDEIGVQSILGLNTFIAEIYHDGTPYESVHDSWFCSEEMGGGLEPTAVMECSN